MRSAKFRSLFALALVAGLVSGCTENSEAPVLESSTSEALASPVEEPAEADESTPTRMEFAPEGEPFVIESVESIAGAELYESDGFSIELPVDWRVERTELDYQATYFAIWAPDRERALLNLVVSDWKNATDTTVEASSQVFETKIKTAGGHSMSRVPLTWPEWSHGVVTCFSLPVGGDDDPAEVQAIDVATRSADGSISMGVTAEAAPGELEESLAFEVLRTLKPTAG